MKKSDWLTLQCFVMLCSSYRSHEIPLYCTVCCTPLITSPVNGNIGNLWTFQPVLSSCSHNAYKTRFKLHRKSCSRCSGSIFIKLPCNAPCTLYSCCTLLSSTLLMYLSVLTLLLYYRSILSSPHLKIFWILLTRSIFSLSFPLLFIVPSVRGSTRPSYHTACASILFL
jgi:hypothetical protein